ncbi:hypothetical protein B0J13DRAFT_604922 [Dactylonectria estremocensis]|uniref:Uncharacterized protein n=1 Tax=Dactylonectria estremocensis TaxID=1079267 RepID=A0A9P9J9U7_9HYPO|nr:hypothetical protein B0J13DRAFT_604922 [Dactylonectria estremocensis]
MTTSLFRPSPVALPHVDTPTRGVVDGTVDKPMITQGFAAIWLVTLEKSDSDWGAKQHERVFVIGRRKSGNPLPPDRTPRHFSVTRFGYLSRLVFQTRRTGRAQAAQSGSLSSTALGSGITAKLDRANNHITRTRCRLDAQVDYGQMYHTFISTYCTEYMTESLWMQRRQTPAAAMHASYSQLVLRPAIGMSQPPNAPVDAWRPSRDPVVARSKESERTRSVRLCTHSHYSATPHRIVSDTEHGTNSTLYGENQGPNGFSGIRPLAPSPELSSRPCRPWQDTIRGHSQDPLPTPPEAP